MRWSWLLVVAVLAGCTGDSVTPVLYDDTLVVPVGLNGYVDLVIDTGQVVSWTWESDTAVREWWTLRCPTTSDGGASDERGTSGQGEVTGPEIGCKLVLFWSQGATTAHVQVRIEGQGSGVRVGTEDGTHRA